MTVVFVVLVLHGNTPVRNCWRMNNKAKDNKWYIIYAKSSQVKEEWMNAFQRERKYVEEDEQKGYFTSSVCIIHIGTFYSLWTLLGNVFIIGFSVSMKMKRAAVALCANDCTNKRKVKTLKRPGQCCIPFKISVSLPWLFILCTDDSLYRLRIWWIYVP